MGNKIAASTVSRYLARAKPRFTAKVAQDQEPEELTDNWREEARKWLRGVKTIALSKRIYEDETPIYANEAPHKGRSRVGKPHQLPGFFSAVRTAKRQLQIKFL